MPSTPTYASALAALPEEARAAIMSEHDSLKKALETAKAAASKPEPTAAEKEAALMASLPAELRERLTSESKARVDAEARAAAHEKRIADLEEARISREYSEKAAKYPHVLGLETGELAEALKCMELGRPITKELGEKVERSFSAMNAALEKSPIFAALGSKNRGGEMSASQRLELIAKELQAKEPALSSAVALTKAIEQNPALYEEHRRGGRSA